VYCGFWRRTFAFFIDSLMLNMMEKFLENFNLEGYFAIIFTLLYWSLTESSKTQASPGKQLLGLKIINKDGTSISFLKSFFRALLLYLVFFVIGMILFLLGIESSGEQNSLIYVSTIVTYLMVGVINMFCIIFTDEETSIPDMICGTRVVKRDDRLTNLNI